MRSKSPSERSSGSGQDKPAECARQTYSRNVVRPIERLDAISRVDMPRAASRNTSRIFRIGNLVIWLSPGQNDRQSSSLQIASQQRIKGWADSPESLGGSDWNGWADQIGITGRMTPEWAHWMKLAPILLM